MGLIMNLASLINVVNITSLLTTIIQALTAKQFF